MGLHRSWFDRSAMGDLLGEHFAIAHSDTLYRCLDKLVARKEALFSCKGAGSNSPMPASRSCSTI